MPVLSDFRLVLSPDVEFSDRELNWDEASHRWRLSDKEYGSVTWELDRNPTKAALEGLREFFEIPVASLGALADLSPGELAAIHSQSHEPARIRAQRCETCGQHSIIYKRSTLDHLQAIAIIYKLSRGTWLKYGLRCESGWWLGDPVSDDEAMGTAGN